MLLKGDISMMQRCFGRWIPWSLLLLAMTVFILSGCASFRNDDLQRVQDFPPVPNGVQKPDVQYTVSLISNAYSSFHNTEQTQEWLKADFAKVLAESGYFANASTNITQSGQGILRIDVELKDTAYGVALIPAIITGLSLYIIPSYYSDDFIVAATVTTVDGQKRLYSLSDGMKTWQWLPMIFVAPSNTSSGVGSAIIHNMWKTLIIKMQRDGILTKRDADKPLQVKPSVSPSKTSPAPATKKSDSKDDAARLEKLMNMKERGLISPEEYERKKKEILDAM